MKKTLLLAALAAVLAAPAWAKNFAVPTNDPAITLTIPDNWTITSIDYGFSASSPGDDVIFFVESARASKVEKMMELNDAWMKEQGIKTIGEPTVIETKEPLEGTIYKYAARDANGPTNVSFILIPTKARLMMLTLWGSNEEQRAHGKAIDAILGSIRAIP